MKIFIKTFNSLSIRYYFFPMVASLWKYCIRQTVTEKTSKFCFLTTNFGEMQLKGSCQKEYHYLNG